MNKAIAFLLTLVLALTLTLPVFAAEIIGDTPWIPEGGDTEPEEVYSVQKCLGYNIVEGSVGTGRSATIELVIFDSDVYGVTSVRKQYTTLGSCDFSQKPADSSASTVTVDKDTRNVIVQMKNLVYSGTGNQLAVDVGYFIAGYGYRSLSFTLNIVEVPTGSAEPIISDEGTPIFLVDSFYAVEPGTYAPEEGTTPESVTPIAGQPFDLVVNLRNAAKSVNATNVTVQVSGGETFQLASGSDTLFVESIPGGSAKTLVIPLTTSNSCTPGASPVVLTCGGTSLTVMVSVTQIDRIKEGELSFDYSMVGNETYFNYGFVNTGFTTLYNAELQVYNSMDEQIASKYIGNIDPAKEVKGSDLSVTFFEAGEQDVRGVLAYEDQNGQPKTYETSCYAYVDEYYEPVWEDPVIDEPIEEEGGSMMWLVWTGIGVLAAAGAAVLLTVLVKKKRAKVRSEMEGYDEDL